jgi:hypothetical protein
MKRKVKRYDEGGDVEEMKKGLFGNKETKEEGMKTLPSAKEKTGTYGPSSSAEPANFKESFAAARKAGDSSFTFNVKKFTTETAAKKPAESVLRNAADEMAKGAVSQSRLSDSIRDDEARVKSNYLKNRDLPTVEDARNLQDIAGSGKYATKNRGTKITGNTAVYGMKKGGAVKSSASSRGDGCAVRGKTRGKIY